MKVIITESYEALSTLTASILLAEMASDKKSNIAITAGNTPKGAYEKLQQMLSQQKNVIEGNCFYNFDELKGRSDTEGVTIKALKQQFFAPLQIPDDAIIQLTPENYETYDAVIQNNGGLDLMLIGLGADGHFCGNMPLSADLEAGTYQMLCKPEYPWYSSLKAIFKEGECPDAVVTMGAKSIYRVRHLVLIVDGEAKADAVYHFMNDKVSNAFPATVLRNHPNFTVILDKGAASKL